MPVILCVDDDAFALRIRKLVLETQGYEVKTATTADEAFQILTSSPIDLVITDHILPRKTGAELLTDIKRLFPDLPVLVLSGMVQPPAGTEAADGYVTKGESVEAFLTHVASLLPNGH
jgi:CheY-like chemotaxis protein